IGDDCERQIGCVRTQFVDGRVEYDNLANRRRDNFLMTLYYGVQVQVTNRTAREASELQMNKLSLVWNQDTFGIDGQKGLRLDDAACLNSTIGPHRDLLNFIEQYVHNGILCIYGGLTSLVNSQIRTKEGCLSRNVQNRPDRSESEGMNG